MKCRICGYLNSEGSNFCSKCGTQLGRICPCCGEPVEEGVKFCSNCGALLDSKIIFDSTNGITIGDKNVIAGDVYGSKDDYHITGNAMIIKNTDDTKKVIACSICGKHLPLVEGYTCPECGRFVCSFCFDSNQNKCVDCLEKERKRKEREYSDFLRKEITGPLSELKVQEFISTGKKYGLSENLISSLITHILNERGTFVRSSFLSETEKEILQNSIDNFYEKWNEKSTEEEFRKIYSIFEQHKNDDLIINALVSIFIRYDFEKARAFIREVRNDSAELYCAKIDLALYDRNVIGAINLIEDAKIVFRNDMRIKAKEIELYLICAATLNQPHQKVKAKELAEKLRVEGNKLERSLAFHARLLAGVYCNDKVDDKYLKEHDLYSGYCLDGMHYIVGNIPICHYSTIMDAIAACPKGGIISIIPGTYEENLFLSKSITIDGNCLNTIRKLYNVEDCKPIIKILNSKPVEIRDDIVFKNVIFSQISENDQNKIQLKENNALLNIAGNAVFFNCIINNCKFSALSIIESGHPAIYDCVIENTGGSGIVIHNIAKPLIKRTKVLKCGGNGIETYDKSAPDISDCLISGCNLSGFYINDNSSGKYTNCTSEINKHNGFLIKGTAKPVFEKCIAKENRFSGFALSENSTGQYISCRSETNKQDGFSIRDVVNPIFEKCISKLNGFQGFRIDEDSTGQYRNCIAEVNTQSGFLVKGGSQSVFEKCIAKSNEHQGYQIDGNSAGQYRDCVAEMSGRNGFLVKGESKPVFENCIARSNELHGFKLGGNSKGQYRCCMAVTNKHSGFLIKGEANSMFEKCIAKSNEYQGYQLEENSTGQYKDCEAESNYQSGFLVKESSNPVLRKCVATSNKFLGFLVSGNSTGHYRDCLANGNKQFGFCIKLTAAPILENCNARENEWSGFNLEGNSSGYYIDCEAEANIQNGFWVKEESNPIFEKCIAKSNELQGYMVDGKSTGQYRDCMAENNKYDGFWATGQASPIFEQCTAASNNTGFFVDTGTNVRCVNCTAKYNNYGVYTKDGAKFVFEKGRVRENHKFDFYGFYSNRRGIKTFLLSIIEFVDDLVDHLFILGGLLLVIFIISVLIRIIF